MAPATAAKRQQQPGGAGSGPQWFGSHSELVAKADCLIGARLADRKLFCDHTAPDVIQICDEIFNNILKRGLNTAEGSENNSVLLLGEAGSGKTHIVEWCVRALRDAQPSAVVLRARGGAYATDVECLRHLATQMSDRLYAVPHANASFETAMEWIRNIFKGSFKHASALVMVLDRFEHFCVHARQTLLYNLFDIAQEVGVHLSIIGTSEKLDVMDKLEKRIKSRFSMRHLQTFLPTTMDGLTKVLMARLRLPRTCGLPGNFLERFHGYIESAILAKRHEWKYEFEMGRPPSWFLARCLPVAHLLQEEVCRSPASLLPEEGPPAGKRARTSVMSMRKPSVTGYEATMMRIHGLCEHDHIVMLALHRLHTRRVGRTLSAALHEIQILHECGGACLTEQYDADTYCSAFDRLLQAKLVELCKSGSADTARQHLPCASRCTGVYAELVEELRAAEPAFPNPLRGLPSPVQQWAMRQQQPVGAQ